MSKGPAIPTKVIAEVARQKAMGKTGRDIAKSIGIPRRTTYQILSKPEIKKFIEDTQAQIITSCLEPIRDNYFHLISNYRTNTNEQEKEHGFSAMKEVCKIAGIAPAALPSVFIQNLMQDNRTQIITPLMQGILEKFSNSLKLSVDEVSGPIIERKERGEDAS